MKAVVLAGPLQSAARRQAIEAQAVERLLVAQASGAEADWDAVYRWIEEDPAHGVAFARAEAAWDMAERLREAPGYGGALTGSESSQPDVAPAMRDSGGGIVPAAPIRRRWLAAAALGACAAIASTVALQFDLAIDNYRTAVGEQRLIRLADGSHVALNTDSAIEVALHDDRRSISLLRGEASFTVAHDPRRPFVVAANGVTLRAVGTAFNVRLRPQLTEVTVTAGTVAIGGDSNSRMVPAGRAAAVRRGAVAVTPLASAAMNRRLAWRSGKLSFDGDTLAQAVEEFNRYRASPIVIGDPALAGIRIGGTFRADGSASFAQALQDSFGIRTVQGRDGSLLLVTMNE
jgi:transmembrane sensor